MTEEPYGATGADATDDTAAIQRALDAASAGATVYVPSGTYFISVDSKIGLRLHSDMTLHLINADGNTITGNSITANGQSSNEKYDNVRVESAAGNTIRRCVVRAGTLHNRPAYGIRLISPSGDNLLEDNDLTGGGAIRDYWASKPIAKRTGP